MTTMLTDEEAARQFCRDYLLPSKKPRLLQLNAREKYSDGNLTKGCFIFERTVLPFDKGQQSEDKFILELRKMDVLLSNGLYTQQQKNAELIHQLQQTLKGANIVYAAESRGGFHST